nr:PAS domain-containing sensor histidine kinase [Desulfobulbaceae bacterium]
AREKNIQILLKCDGAIRAPMNSHLMEQALSNLIVNAIKYTEAGSKVLVRAIEENPRTILIEVEDFGIGIDEKHLPRLFERFYRSDKARSRKLGGTGLGLAIVKHIVMAHHGRVGVRSTVKKGTTFMIRLPRHRVLPEDFDG